MSHFANKLYSLFAFCIVAVLCGCSSDCVPDVVEPGGMSYYLRLNLSVGDNGQTRAVDEHPWGGETGDGTEAVDAAHPHENDIQDLTIYIYKGTGVNDPSDTHIKTSKYFNGLSLKASDSYTTDPLEIKDPNYVKEAGDRIIVLANMGDMSGLETLGEVRDLLVNTAWARNGSSIKDYFYFAMSSSIDNTTSGVLNTTKAGTYSDPFLADVTIERVAARIDFWLIKDLDTDEDYATYNVGAGTDKFRLSHVRIVNGSQMPTYNLKRTAETVNPLGTVTYLSDEEVNTGTYIPTNYVVEPLTTKKNGSAVISNTTLNYWFGASSLKNSTSLDFLNNSESKIASHKLEKFTTPELDDAMDHLDGTDDHKITCYTLGYVMENTMDKTGQIPQFATGLELKGTFVPDPSHVNKLSGGVAEADLSYSPGSDFWYYVSTDESTKIIFSNEADATTYEAAHSGTVKKYTNGECYYYVWIRHAMYDSGHGTGTYPMEYGIVRNNIYRIGVRKVEFIGTEVPDPGATPLTSTMTVREWRLLKHSEIVL